MSLTSSAFRRGHRVAAASLIAATALAVTAGTASAQSGSAPQPASATCAAKDLGLRLGDSDPGAGNIRYPLVFTNKGKSTCSLRGFPGVSLLAGNGQKIGAPATREGAAGQTVELAPGKSAHATLRTINEGLNDTPCWTTGKIVHVYAPNSKDAMTLRTQGLRVCGGVFTVSAVTPGTEG